MIRYISFTAWLNGPLYIEEIIKDNLPSVEEAMIDLKAAWGESLKAEANLRLF